MNLVRNLSTIPIANAEYVYFIVEIKCKDPSRVKREIRKILYSLKNYRYGKKLSVLFCKLKDERIKAVSDKAFRII